MNIPADPMMLLSFLNMKLRDEYPSLTELCLSLDLDEKELLAKMRSIDYEYDQGLNRFV